MVEKRRRQIIRNLSPEVTEDRGVIEAQIEDIEHEDVPEEELVEYPSNENLLGKRVYLPMPVILLGFLTIVFASVTLTFVAMNLPAPGLDFPENPELARFEAAANPGTLPEKTFQPDPALAVNAPVSDLGTMSVGAARFAPLRQNQVPNNLGRTFAQRQITETNIPVAILRPTSHLSGVTGTDVSAKTLVPTNPGTLPQALGVKAPVIDLTSTLRIADAPITRTAPFALPPQENLDLATAVGVNAPTTLLVLTTRNPGDVIELAQTTPQKLMRQRYAKAVTSPEMEAGGNPLLQPATGRGLPTKIASLEGVTGVSPPVADLQFGDPSGIAHEQTAANLETKQYTIREPFSLKDPVVDMTLPERAIKSAPEVVINSGLETKNYQIRKTSTLKAPVVDLVLAERQVGYTAGMDGETGLVIKNVTLTEALGLDSPKVLLNLPVRRASASGNKLNVPDQKLMQRRYARAVTNPQQMEFNPPSQPTRAQPTLDRSLNDLDPWQRYAAVVPADIEGKGRIVIIIDDMGNNSNMARALGELDGPLTFAFLPYAPNLQRQTTSLRAQGHELLVHMPMEPIGNESPGPNALLTSLTDAELLETIDWNLTRFDGFVGVNNHMGSRFTKDSARMKLVMEELQKRGLLFLDSRTAPNSEGAKWAKRLRLPWAGRDVFLDNEVTVEAIMSQLKKVEVLAHRRGTVIAIGHPHGATLRALEAWIPTLEGKGLVLVPLSSIVEFEGQSKLASADPGQ